MEDECGIPSPVISILGTVRTTLRAYSAKFESLDAHKVIEKLTATMKWVHTPGAFKNGLVCKRNDGVSVKLFSNGRAMMTGIKDDDMATAVATEIASTTDSSSPSSIQLTMLNGALSLNKKINLIKIAMWCNNNNEKFSSQVHVIRVKPNVPFGSTISFFSTGSVLLQGNQSEMQMKKAHEFMSSIIQQSDAFNLEGCAAIIPASTQVLRKKRKQFGDCLICTVPGKPAGHRGRHLGIKNKQKIVQQPIVNQVIPGVIMMGSPKKKKMTICV